MGARIDRPTAASAARHPRRAADRHRLAPDVPSAQVKSAVLLAGLTPTGRRPCASRPAPAIIRSARSRRSARDVGHRRPGDRPSTAASGSAPRSLARPRRPLVGRLLGGVAAAALPGSRSRSRALASTRRGRRCSRPAPRRAPTSTLASRATTRRRAGRHASGCACGASTRSTIAPEEVPGCSSTSCRCSRRSRALGGSLEVSGAGELRVKESDRITALVAGLRALGVDADERPDGFVVAAGAAARRQGDAAGDHRLVMAFAVAALGAPRHRRHHRRRRGRVSYPGFFDALRAARA